MKKLLLSICPILALGLVSCGGNESRTEYEVTAPTYQDSDGEMSFKGGSVEHVVIPDHWRDGHAFEAIVKRGPSVTSTTKCIHCGHSYQNHNY